MKLLITCVLGFILLSCDKNNCSYVPLVDNGSCIDSTLIVDSSFCMEVYDPVCGCDGITYSNSCYATNFSGLTSYVPGECRD